ncbi:MAG: hypothetical protein AVDCRST_MAG93-4057, partial [uncultured Chloroflexia bacterium]
GTSTASGWCSATRRLRSHSSCRTRSESTRCSTTSARSPPWSSTPPIPRLTRHSTSRSPYRGVH